LLGLRSSIIRPAHGLLTLRKRSGNWNFPLTFLKIIKIQKNLNSRERVAYFSYLQLSFLVDAAQLSQNWVPKFFLTLIGR